MKNIINRGHLYKLPHRKQVMFALFCAERVVHLVEPRYKLAYDNAISTIELWLEGKATAEQCRDVGYKIAYAVRSAAYTAASTENPEYYAARTAQLAYYTHTRNYDDDDYKFIKEQWDYYNALLNLDDYIEDIIA